jgi:uncharacterized membrane protein YkoI
MFALVSLCICQMATPVLADDGGSNSGSGSSGSNSGSGSGNSGGDDDDGDDNSGKGNRHNREQDDVRQAVLDGRAVSLKRLLSHIADNYPGRVLDINLRRSSDHFVYRVKMLTPRKKLTTIELNAVSLRAKF